MWIVTIYQVPMILLMLPFAGLGERIGLKRIVVSPASSTLSIPSAVSVQVEMAKKALGCCLEITSSSSCGARPSGRAPIGFPRGQIPERRR